VPEVDECNRLLATSDLRLVLAEFTANIDHPDSVAASNAESLLDFCRRITAPLERGHRD